jgi:hypothetical protein
MEVQSQIKRSLSAPQALDEIRLLLAGGQEADRTGLARAVFERFGFYDGCGRTQVVGYLKVLRDLERGGRVELPAARSCPSRGTARLLESAVPWPAGPLEPGEGLDSAHWALWMWAAVRLLARFGGFCPTCAIPPATR